MIEKKSSKGNLDKRKSTFLLIGFIVILGLVYAGFELYASGNLKVLGMMDIDPIYIPEENIVRTDPTPPPPQSKQPAEVILQIIKNNPAFNIDISNFFLQDIDQNDRIPDYEFIPLPDEGESDFTPVPFAEVMPEPIDGFDAMYAFLKANLQYPEHLRTNAIQGQVFLEFVVEKDGSITNVTVKAGVHPALDQEAMRVVKMMPKWKPGKQMGKPVRCYYLIPVRFNIN